jgi:hypothetical protein
MKYFKTILTTILLTVVTTCIAGQTSYVKAESGVNLRSGKGTNHSVIATIPANSEVKVIKVDGDWCEVEFNGKKGYVNSSFLSDNKVNSSTTENRTSKNQKSSSSNSLNQKSNWAIGIRLGDPSGITIKKNMDNSAFELNIGRTHLWNGGDWYDGRFYDWYNKKNYVYQDFQYLGYRASAPIAFQLHYLIKNNINKLGNESIRGLHWYYGFGGQLRFQSYTFDYRYKYLGNTEWLYATGESVTDLDLGVDGVIGLEFRFKNSPISIFTDITLFMEVADNPFLFWFQGGIGGRYNF